MDEKKSEIILQATEIYMRFGIKSVTMDEMARQIGVSKKTLYIYFKDKNDLLMECMRMAQNHEVCEIEEIGKRHENAIDEMLEVSRFVIGELKKVHPSIFFDLQKYHPKVMTMMHDHLYGFVKECMLRNLEKGKKQGLYRKNMNTEIVATLYMSIIDRVIGGIGFEANKAPLDEVYREFFRYHIRGIASENGLEYLIELKKNDENF